MQRRTDALVSEHGHERLVAARPCHRQRDAPARSLVPSSVVLCAAVWVTVLGSGGTAFAQTTRDIWTATLTVGSSTTDATLLGWSGFADQFDNDDLTDRDFQHADDDWRLTELSLSSTDSKLLLDFVRPGTSPSVLESLVLHIGSDTFSLVRADKKNYPDALFHWVNTGLSWSTGDTIVVKLTEPTLSIDDAAAVIEGESAEFTVRLSAPGGAAVSVSYATVDGTAAAGSDYTTASGMLRFQPGETSQTITVTTLDDAESEVDETFTVALSAASGATIAGGIGVGTIADNERRRQPPTTPPPTTPPPTTPGRTAPPTLDLTCHGYDEGGGTRAYNCIPEPSQQHHMRTFVPAVGSACDGGRIAEFPPGRIVFQIRCGDASQGQSAAWTYSGHGSGFFVLPVDTPRVWVRTAFSGSSAHLSVWCRAPQESLVVNELLGTSWGNDGTTGIYGMAGCHEVEVDTGGQDVQWWFTQEPAATAPTPPRSWEHVTGAGSALPVEAHQDLAAAGELDWLWRRPDRERLHPLRGPSIRGALQLTADDDGDARLDPDSASRPHHRTHALEGLSFRGATRTTPLTLALTCHGYVEGGGTRAYNCIPEPSQQHHMRTFVPAVGSACDGGRIAEFPPGRIVFQIRCGDASQGQSAAWTYSGHGSGSFVLPVDTPRVWVRTAFSGNSAHLSVWCRARQESLVVNELLGTSWGNDGTTGIYGMAGCHEVEVDTGGQDVQWWFTQELAATALTPPRSWEHVTGAGDAMPVEARQDLAAAAEFERLWSRPAR